MKHFDLFSGYGGFSLALEKVYGTLHSGPAGQEEQEIDTDVNLSDTPSTDSREFTTIGFSEIDKYASAVLKYHWPNTKNYGDITKINWSEVPDFDLLTGGSPCQDLSIAGKRAGLGGKRSGLFYEFMRAVKEKKPKYFIWENVKGALSSNNGRDFGSVVNEMAEAGYSLWWQVLNAKDFGVPQNRERIFVIGFRDGSPREIFFERGGDTKDISQINNPTHSNNRLYSEEGISPALNTAQCGNRQPKIYDDYNSKMRTDDLTCSLTTNCGAKAERNGMKVVENTRIRRLTPTECERLMGLPDDWTSKGIIDDKEVEISDSQRYKLCGNGVVVNVVEEIIKELIIGS